MIQIQVEKILKNGLDINTWSVLHLKSKGFNIDSIESTRFKGWTTICKRKGFLDNELDLTELGRKLIEDIEDLPEIVPINGFEIWTEQLLVKLKSKLKEIIGKDQIKGFGGVYFIPGLQDLRIFMTRWNKRYKISIQDNKDKIEKVLLRHVEACAKTKKFAPAVKYYINHDDRGSELTSALDNFEEKVDTVEEKQFNLVKTKDLFN